MKKSFPDVTDPAKVGTYPAQSHAGGGSVWDAVLEYRVWVHEDGESDSYSAFATYEEALAWSKRTTGAEEPLALIRQDEYLDEPEPGVFVHVKEVRVTEWPVEFLSRPRRTARTIPEFLSPKAPANRLDILRGLARPKGR
ncbi:MAG: GCN5 family acetyltransferase [Deltaproteobacteria bacterium]|nr:GCN5 family acetyltransferase [Deltaproteobacteria bacterium]